MAKVQNKKSIKIFSKIFWPVVQIIIIFAVATFLINYFSIDRFVKDNAKEKLEEVYNDIISQVSDFALSGEKEFKFHLSEKLVNQNNSTGVYIYDKDYNEISLFDNNAYIDKRMLLFLASLLSDYELEEGILTNISYGGKEYIANMYATSNSLNIKEKYFVVIQELTGKTNLLRESSKQFIVIQFLVLLLVIITIYLIAKDLSKPLIKLSKESEEYVIGKGVTIDNKSTSTAELESLRQSLIIMQKKIDEEINKKNTIYENVAHDLRTPLVSILGYADGLKSGIIKDKNKACEVILRTGNQLKEMIENILVLSRFDNNTYKSNIEEINIVDLILEQIEIVKVIDEDKKIEFENCIYESQDEKAGIITTDRKLLVRIIQNLLSNAIKYAKSSIKVEVSYKSEYNESSYNIIISDDGKGIDKNELNNIFTRYYKGKDGHFGIGLAVVKSSVDYIGAKIEVDSEEKIGTTFRITINQKKQ